MHQRLSDLMEIIHFSESVSTRIQGLLDEAQIYRTVTEEFARSKRYNASILLLTDSGAKLRIAETSLPAQELKEVEKATGVRLKGYRVDLNGSRMCSRVIRDGETVLAKIGETMSEFFPQPVAHLISKTLGYEKKESILTPFKRNGKTIGILAISSTDLADHFIPSVKCLAQHLSAALELAHENTERKRAEGEIESYRKRLESLINSSRDLIFLKDENLRYLVANEAHEKLFGVKLQNIIGKTDFDFMPTEVAQACRQSDLEALKRGFVSQEECLDDRCFEVAKQRVVDAKGKVVGIAAVIRDITERKRAEEELRESQKRLSEQNILLEEKNIALREVMGQLKAEKERIEDQIQTNVGQLLLPLLTRLKEKGSEVDRSYLNLLEDNLKELTSSFGNEISRKVLGLTQREIEICNLIKGGLTSKEIAGLLKISHKTAERHRNNIRNKLEITNDRINLTTYLKAI